ETAGHSPPDLALRRSKKDPLRLASWSGSRFRLFLFSLRGRICAVRAVSGRSSGGSAGPTRASRHLGSSGGDEAAVEPSGGTFFCLFCRDTYVAGLSRHRASRAALDNPSAPFGGPAGFDPVDLSFRIACGQSTTFFRSCRRALDTQFLFC